MSEESTKGNGQASGDGEGSSKGEGQDIAKLSEQIENLNTGIAKYRDENKNTRDELTKANEKIETLTKAKEKDDGVELSAEDEKKLDVLLKKKGVVLHADLQKKEKEAEVKNLQSVEKSATASFLKAHPEYDDNSEWQKVATEFALYKTPDTVEGFNKILEKIHKDLSGSSQRKKGKAEARAEDHNAKSLSLGGGSQSAGSSDDDEDDMDELRKKYPSLSEDQIRETLNEISNLYPKKEDKK